MKTTALTLTLCLAAPALADKPADKEIDLEARKRSIPILEAHLKDREERVAEIASDILRLDNRLEAKVDKIVRKLAGLKDSTTSGYRVSQVKMDAMEGLQRSIETYQSKRAALIQDARKTNTDIPREVLTGDAAKFDARIEKRVQQILELSKSFTQEADVEKYRKIAGGGTYYHGWNGVGWHEDLYEISDEWRQNRRDRTMDGKQRKEVLEALAKSIERHESLIAGLKDSLANRRMSATDRTLMTAELKRHETLLRARRDQLQEMKEVDLPSTTALDRNEAHDLEEALADATGDMRRDFETIFAKYAELNRERQKMFAVKTNLEARRKWLEEHAE